MYTFANIYLILNKNVTVNAVPVVSTVKLSFFHPHDACTKKENFSVTVVVGV